MNSGFFEEELFRRCKNNDSDSKATAGVLLGALESMGILSDDPRLSPLMEALREIQGKCTAKICSINNIKLDYNQFTKVVNTCKCLISDVLEGNVVIPEALVPHMGGARLIEPVFKSKRAAAQFIKSPLYFVGRTLPDDEVVTSDAASESVDASELDENKVKDVVVQINRMKTP